MKKGIKSIINIILGFLKLFTNTLYSLIQIIRFSNFKPFFQKIESAKTKSLAIIGNGPSFKKEINDNYFKIIDCDIVVVNNFAFSKEYERLKPNYYIFADPAYWLKNEDTTSECIEKRIILFKRIKDLTNWEIKLVIPFGAFKSGVFQKEFNENVHIKLIPINYVSFTGFSTLKFFLYKNNLAMPHPQNVVIAAIFHGLNMGYKKLVLFGVDHNWTKFIRVNRENQVCFCDNHFYDTEKSKLVPWLTIYNEQYKMHELLFDLAKMFAGYHELKRYADYVEATIFNCSKDSFIDAFQRISIE